MPIYPPSSGIKKNLTIPPFLQKGDTIGIATPASPYRLKSLEAGIQILKQWGFRVALPRKIVQRGYLAGTDRERAEELTVFFEDPAIKAILCSRGGYGAMRLLDLLDYNKIKKQPKFFMGFSDITVLLLALWKKAGLMSFHGPMITSLPHLNRVSLTRVRSVLSGAYSLEIRLNRNRAFPTRSTEGILLGGNLTLLVHLIGTPYEPDWNRAILFLEDCGEAPYRIDRLFSHLKMSGALKKISAILLGQFTGSDNTRLTSRLFKTWLGESDVPVWTGLPIGHGHQNIPLPVGAPACLDAEKGLLSVNL
jgi:muramoyltetrapeptide carboxypeptidase